MGSKREVKKDDILAPLAVEFPKGFRAGSSRRKSVSAEVDGARIEEKWEKKIVPKTDEALARIKKATADSFLFASLSENQKKDIYDCMNEIKVKKGQEIIRQGAEGDFFYVIDSGKYDVFKTFDGSREEKKVFHYDEIGSFGELALMYNCPRAATVKATTDGVLWAVDRLTFRHIVVANAAKDRRKREEWLEQVSVLADLTKAQRSQVADCLVTQEFKDGEINKIPAGEYFGERALLEKNPKRTANVKAIGPLKVAVIDRASFERLFGSVSKLMKRKIDKYKSSVD